MKAKNLESLKEILNVNFLGKGLFSTSPRNMNRLLKANGFNSKIFKYGMETVIVKIEGIFYEIFVKSEAFGGSCYGFNIQKCDNIYVKF